jgi:hypothetical protein
MQGATHFMTLSANVQWKNRREPSQTVSAQRRALLKGWQWPPAPWLRLSHLRVLGPPASSSAAASHHGDAGGRSLLLSIGDGNGPSLGGVDGSQAVSPDGEGSQITRLYLPQLCPQGLWETLHEEVVGDEDGEQRAEVSPMLLLGFAEDTIII